MFDCLACTARVVSPDICCCSNNAALRCVCVSSDVSCKVHCDCSGRCHRELAPITGPEGVDFLCLVMFRIISQKHTHPRSHQILFWDTSLLWCISCICSCGARAQCPMYIGMTMMMTFSHLREWQWRYDIKGNSQPVDQHNTVPDKAVCVDLHF